MKKILSLLFLGLALFLVACDPTQENPTGVKVDNLTFTSKTVTADINIELEIETLSSLKEIIESTVYAVYNNHKDTFGTDTYTLYFSVYLDSESVGEISYKVNASLQNPGLTYVADTLQLP
ncbi:hypothetical protein JV173_02360 [Acholeplasma equirhinis]|uniref:hypothetical protein n=1 Tax=Acholeplasma equirhinis TaxID=555393 RepID=UPI00197A8C01|nr:hypothetical protein [Acholeplasma equirhinis]MBN3490350.1 hypothetical protein [Acholeplasma equirhinis]